MADLKDDYLALELEKYLALTMVARKDRWMVDLKVHYLAPVMAHEMVK